MNTISLKQYAPIISEKSVGNEIYDKISQKLTENDKVEVEISGIISMATFCAKQIFGQLYIEHGSTDFFRRIHIKDASDDLKSIIRIGIQNAIASQDIISGQDISKRGTSNQDIL